MISDVTKKLNLSAVLKYQEDKSGIKWIFSSIKKYKVFLIIFESNELEE